MNRLYWVPLVMLFAASACSNLRSIEEGVCGNRVLDPQEDCDTFTVFAEDTLCGAPNSANQCAYVCESGASCPSGWGCGTDGRCRQALGKVQRASGSPWRLTVNDFKIGDVDGDGNADLIGDAESSVSVRFGTGTGEFPTELRVNTSTQTNSGQIVDLNADGLLDVITPVLSGISTMLGQPDRTMQPTAYSPHIPPEGVSIRFLPVEGNLQDPSTEIVILLGKNMVLFFEAGSEAVPLPENHSTDELVGRVPIADIDFPADGKEEWVLAFSDASSVFLYSIEGAVGALAPTPRLEIDLPGIVNRGARFADVDGNGWLDIMISIHDSNDAHRVAVAYSDSAGVIDAVATIVPIFDDILAVWPLAAGDLTGDGKADYVGEDAIWIADFAALPPVVAPPTTLNALALNTNAITNPWVSAAMGDFNGDGNIDVAVGAEDADGLDFFLGSGFGLFNNFQVNTEGPATLLRSGDFDGDFVADLAFVQQGFGIVPDELLVSYGDTSGGPGQPISMGGFEHIEEVEQAHIFREIGSIDVIDDIFVLSRSLTNQAFTSVAALVGTSQRRMISPFALSRIESLELVTDTPFRVLVGNFVELAGESVDALDIVSIALIHETAPSALSGSPEFRLWRVPGEGTAGGLSSDGAVSADMPPALDFRAQCSEWGVIDAEGDGFDELIGIDGNFECFGDGSSPEPRLIIIHPPANEGILPDSQVVPIPGGLTAINKIEVLDLDADGDLDVAALFRGEAKDGGIASGTEEAVSGSGLLVLWNEGGTISATTRSVIQIPDATLLFDFTFPNLDNDTEPEIAVMTSSGIYAANLDRDSREYLEARLLVQNFGPGKIDAADVNGDGVDDIAWTEGKDVNVYLGIVAPPLGEGAQILVPGDDGGSGQ